MEIWLGSCRKKIPKQGKLMVSENQKSNVVETWSRSFRKHKLQTVASQSFVVLVVFGLDSLLRDSAYVQWIWLGPGSNVRENARTMCRRFSGDRNLLAGLRHRQPLSKKWTKWLTSTRSDPHCQCDGRPPKNIKPCPGGCKICARSFGTAPDAWAPSKQSNWIHFEKDKTYVREITRID